uniref:Uncharacterized protein n=1 Tax=Candidatus Kentrum sp. LPFa TaxID=2126335 RepID=A0A450WTJ0_9GAMM|nr:MAG: hypothetical protein BECKLPF1236B_GA0070989_12098 [Candidatus Kentron sp. LPFa]
MPAGTRKVYVKLPDPPPPPTSFWRCGIRFTHVWRAVEVSEEEFETLMAEGMLKASRTRPPDFEAGEGDGGDGGEETLRVRIGRGGPDSLSRCGFAFTRRWREVTVNEAEEACIRQEAALEVKER